MMVTILMILWCRQVGYITGVLLTAIKQDLAGDIATVSLAGAVQVRSIQH